VDLDSRRDPVFTDTGVVFVYGKPFVQLKLRIADAGTVMPVPCLISQPPEQSITQGVVLFITVFIKLRHHVENMKMIHLRLFQSPGILLFICRRGMPPFVKGGKEGF
jgi:hypothetical protein